jgi:hypothetical membrane protein
VPQSKVIRVAALTKSVEMMMVRDTRFLYGVWAALSFALGMTVLALFVPGYNSVRQTVSEIGEMTSPMRWPFVVWLSVVAVCLLVFASAVRRMRGATVLGTLGAFCIAWMAAAAVGTGLFAYPHSLHNVFGISELIAYQAPLLCALAWRRNPELGGAVAFSNLMYALTLLSVTINLAIIPRSGVLWQVLAPINGLVQRSLFVCFFIWCAVTGWLLWRHSQDMQPAG